MKMIKLVTGGITLGSAALLLGGCVIDENIEKHGQFSGHNDQWWQVHDGKGVTGHYYGAPAGQPFHHYLNEDHGAHHAHERKGRDAHQLNRPFAKTDDLDPAGFYHHGDKPDAFRLNNAGSDHTQVYERGWFGKNAKEHRPGFTHGK